MGQTDETSLLSNDIHQLQCLLFFLKQNTHYQLPFTILCSLPSFFMVVFPLGCFMHFVFRLPSLGRSLFLFKSKLFNNILLHRRSFRWSCLGRLPFMSYFIYILFHFQCTRWTFIPYPPIASKANMTINILIYVEVYIDGRNQ